ncbi:hypothetical protein [Lactococcus lactis]|uniref:hypothetical protein n=1 Tax=Lactococcus lactis TaxID=1358 RepID=UPI002891F824|nr:hypothetical protein [Lactococcus lactis]MDT2898851.1 hypothetical protein [Lactococcus lactis]
MKIPQILKKIPQLAKSLLGKRKPVSIENNHGNISNQKSFFFGLTNTGSSTIHNTTVQQQSEMQNREEKLVKEQKLYNDLLKYKNDIYGIDPRKLPDVDDEALKKLQDSIKLNINLLQDDYPDVCNYAQNVVDSINTYRMWATPYGNMKINKTDNDSNKNYNQICKNVDDATEELFNSFDIYSQEHKKIF